MEVPTWLIGYNPAVTDNVLPYESPLLRRQSLLRRHFHTWLLPLVWILGSLGSCVYYGDEYFGFAMANLPVSVVLVYLVNLLRVPEGEWIFPAIVAVGLILWAAVGWLLDRMRAWRWMYLLIPIAFVLIAISGIGIPGNIPPIPYRPGREWEWDAVFVAYCWAVYSVVIVAMVYAAVGMIVRRTLGTRPQISQMDAD